MRRNRFEEISSVIHAADNDNIPENDKLEKLHPLIDDVNKQFIRYAPIEPNVSIDESMIPYYGPHGCKQFIKSKPIRFGYKAWVAALKSGYCLQFDIYQGRKDKKEKKEMGLGESVVLNFAKLLKQNYPDKRFSLYFDNFFTSTKLIRTLGKDNFGATGTVRDNRTNHCPLRNPKVMKGQERAIMDCAVSKNNDIVGVRWKDNNVVTMLSNQYGKEHVQKCTRYSALLKHAIIPVLGVTSKVT